MALDELTGRKAKANRRRQTVFESICQRSERRSSVACLGATPSQRSSTATLLPRYPSQKHQHVQFDIFIFKTMLIPPEPQVAVSAQRHRNKLHKLSKQIPKQA